LQISDPAKSKA